MAEHETGPSVGAGDSPAGLLTDEQRATFRAAGFWMAIIGWAEVVLGGVAGLALLLSTLGPAAAPGPAAGPGPAELRFLILQAAGSVVIGILTLVAARSFRRAGRNPATGLPAIAGAVGDLAELYERQVWLAALFLVLTIAGALARWW